MIDTRRFGAGLAFGLAVIGLLPAFHGKPIRIWALAAALLIALLAVLRPSWLQPPQRLAMALQRGFGWCLMAFAYFVILTPVAVIGRIVGRDPLRLKREPARSSYWIDRASGDPAGDSLTRPY